MIETSDTRQRRWSEGWEAQGRGEPEPAGGHASFLRGWNDRRQLSATVPQPLLPPSPLQSPFSKLDL